MVQAPADVKLEQRGTGQRVKRALSYAALILLTILFVAPLVWMLVNSFKTNPETTRWPLTWIPREFSVQGYSEIFNTTSQTPVFRWFLNSVVAAVAHTVLVLVKAAPAAYALARMDFRGKNLMFGAIISTLFIPPVILF